MVGEQYFLILKDKDEKLYRVFKTPITLKAIDERTTKYQNKTELVTEIIKNTRLNINPKDIVSVEIWRRPSSKIEKYKEERGPLYKKDAGVLNIDSVAAKLELMAKNKDFVLYFIKRYIKVRNLGNIALSIEACIRNNNSYAELFQDLAEKILSTYKGSRNAYLAINHYENSLRKKIGKLKTDSLKDSIEYGNDLSKEEFEEVRLNYLLEHERELLDIEDFNYNPELSPFDEHKIK